MSRKQSQKDSSGFIFDLQSSTVLAQGRPLENMKEKINAIRAIVPNKSNNEIILILQHFDNCVDRTVQAFMEEIANEVLKEWTVTDNKKEQKEEKQKKKKPAAEVCTSNSLPNSSKSVSIEEKSAPSSERAGIHGYHVNGAINDAESVDSLSEGLETLSVAAREAEHPNSNKPDTLGRTGSNIEKSVKDLQRCTVFLAQYRAVVKEEMDTSIKKMMQAFVELQTSLTDREVALLAEMDKVKAEAMEILLSKQKKAELLKKMTDGAMMSKKQLIELRTVIKYFVSERKYDEDLGRVARFTCDIETVKKSINSFGQVSHPKNSYSTRSPCGSVLSVSLGSPGDAYASSSSTCASAPSLTGANKRNSAPGETSIATANSSSRAHQPHCKVLQGNRQGRQSYRTQGQKSTDSMNQHDSVGCHRNSSWYSSGSRYQNTLPQVPGNTSEQGQAFSTGTNGTGTSMEPASKPSFRKGRPQHKPRTSQPESVNS
ncbi:LOW QUALITY PROTEIN: spermatogenesis-associated serine-rich protein 2-like [Ctenodactylus gundi]